MNKLQDENLQFDEPTHVYSLKNAPETEFTSATTFIHRFFEPFDREKIATKLLNLPKYQGKTREDLFQDWKQSGISGTNIHAALENVILDHMGRSEDYNFPKSCENNVEKYCMSSVEKKKAENGIEWLKNNLLFEDYLEPSNKPLENISFLMSLGAILLGVKKLGLAIFFIHLLATVMMFGRMRNIRLIFLEEFVGRSVWSKVILNLKTLVIF